jgi:predicted RNA binding protein YcfA (HicA-like mRNA interferase family)
LKLRPLPSQKVIKALEKIGFSVIRQRGSHAFLRHPDGRTTVVPIHPGEKIGRGLLRKIIKDAKLTREEFLRLVEGI